MTPEARLRGAEPALTDVYWPRRTYWHLVGPAGPRTRGVAPTDWRLRLDPENAGLTEGWPERGLPADAGPAEVPGVWNTIAPGYAGAAWYEARCRPDLLFRGTIWLVVGAANYLTDAWLNGVYLGRHEGGYDAFRFRCTDVIRRGENRVTLRIVDPPQEGEIDGLRLRECPTGKESWYGGYGGPWGGAWFEEAASVMSPAPEPSHVWIEDVRVQGDLVGERATFHVTLASDLATTVSVDLAPQVGATHVLTTVDVPPTGAVTTHVIEVPAPRRWSPESPELYGWTVGARISGTESADIAMGRFGFRTCEWRDGVFFLNGEPRYLKGGLLQPTYPRTLATPTRPVHPGEPLSNEEARDPEGRRRWFAEIPPYLLDEDVRIAKEAGLNLIRCHLRPPPPGFLRQCDEQGIMAYVEPPLAWIEPTGRLLEHGKRELAAMVRACGNHPSVVLWGIFNENAKATEAVGGELMAELVRLDPTRPMIENSGGAAVGETGMWAWGGQSRCWSPGWEAPRPLNDVHVYLANPPRREAWELMATVGDGATLDVTPGRSAGDRIESRMSGDAVLVSEYGCGALPDFEAALAAFGEETHLADAVLLRELRDSLAEGLSERGLDREIGDVASLVRKTQALQAEGIVAQTAALRRNPNVSGLILTQLADAGWEQMAGLVGLWRHPRPALEALKRALAPRLLHVEVEDRFNTGQFRVLAWLIEDPGLEPLPYPDGSLIVNVERRPDQPPLPAGESGPREVVWTGERRVRVAQSRPLGERSGDGAPVQGVKARGMLRPFPVNLPAEPGPYLVRTWLWFNLWAEEAQVCVWRLPDRTDASGEGLVLLGRGLRRDVPDARTDLPADWTGPILAHLATRPSQASLALAVERARAGAHLCLVGMDPASAKQVERLIDLPLRTYSGRGNFMGVYHYMRDHPLFDGLGAPCLADSAFAEVLPAWVLVELPSAEVLAGCFTVPDGGRGFLWRASVQTLSFGRGRLTLCQLGIGERHGGALGRYLLDRLVGWLG